MKMVKHANPLTCRFLASAGLFCLVASSAFAQPVGENILKPGDMIVAIDGRVVNPGYLGLAADENPNGRGAKVVEVNAGSPAAKAGLKPGDVILAIDGRVLEELAGMIDAMKMRQPGDKVKLDVLRQNRLMRFELALAPRPRQPGAPAPGALAPGPLPRDYVRELLGLQLDTVPASARSAGGVVVARVLVRTGDERPRIPSGAFIREIDRVPVKSVADCQRILSKFRPGDRVQVTYVVENLVKRVSITLGVPRTREGNPQVGAPERPGLIESRLGESGRRPILGRLGRALDGALGDAAEGAGLPGQARPAEAREVEPPFEILRPQAPREGAGPDDVRNRRETHGNDELANEVRELRFLIEVLLERVEELEKNAPLPSKKGTPDF